MWFGVPDDQEELISRDFVTAIEKIRGYNPRETTVQFYNPSTVFSRKLHDQMRSSGYGIQIVGKGDTAINLVTFESERYESSHGSSIVYEVTVGRIKLGREYEIRAGRVFPIAALSVNGGTTIGQKTVDNTIFNDINSGWSEVPSTSTSSKHDDGMQYQNVIVKEHANDRLAIGTKPLLNVAETGISNFEPIFSGYTRENREVLVFENDSMVLGRRNKRAVAEFIEGFDPETDLISLIGCSNGKTTIKNGNALLATGRASRVKEELVRSDISPEHILDEGCWASEHSEKLPRRGVVITLLTKPEQA